MRRTRTVTAVLVAGLLLGGCSQEVDPLVGEWVADGPQPRGFSDFGDRAIIRVDEDGEAILGTSPSDLCGNAEVTAGEGDGEFRIAFESRCLTVGVPVSLDVVLDGDTLEAVPTGRPDGEPYRFRRAD
ncbi:fimbrillin family protein [Streptomyces sp. KLOTTS4A1]|uniref:fimbrillin family protein n=1 Tax=Streptomyces sp. KLOTTS4A1 TaxID=3390996 RepID=UPI0039F6421E